MVNNGRFNVNKSSHRLAAYAVVAMGWIGITALWFAGLAALFFTTSLSVLPAAIEYFWRAPLALSLFIAGFGLWYQLMMFWCEDEVKIITDFIAELRSLHK